jgi:hypothetical protein
MQVMSGKFSNPETHHEGYARVFRFTHAVEIWIGARWITIDWGKRG